ncbi:MAG TPA: hypothetical protein VGS57_11910 [Thermoanaerobaculia bacterium]|jgi:hypothetical protein|nr:hypothetical protein [Thermoanaerobaculia bacterium]
MRQHRSFAFALLLLPLAAAAFANLPDAPPVPAAQQESVAVDLRTVPFYAVDAQGEPVFDLRADEVELRVDGHAVPIDTFDRHRLDGSAPAPGSTNAAGVAAPPSRDVYLVLDQAFLSFAGLRDARAMAENLAGAFQPSDRLTLIVNDPQLGFRSVLGPVAGDRSGQRQLHAALGKGDSHVDRLRTDPGLPPMVIAGPIGEQVHNAYEAGGSLMKAEYRAAAYELADSLRLFALQLNRSSAPKVVIIITPGIDSQLYFEGEIGFTGVGSDGDALHAHVDLRRAGPMIQKFQPALAALAASGANYVLVNPDAQRQSGREMLAQVHHEVGGLMLENASPTKLVRELRASTAAYYVAGFYAQGDASPKPGTTVEVVVKRPGVRVSAPHGVRAPRPWSTLDADERRLAVLDVVQRGAYETESGPRPDLVAKPLQAQVRGAAAAAGDAPGAKRLELLGQWPPELAGHKVEVYEVVMRPSGAGSKAALLSFRESAREPPAEPLRAELAVAAGPQVWAVVVVEPSSGGTYLRRLQITGPPVPPAR